MDLTKKQDMDYGPVEKYTLTLKRELIDPNGKAHLLDEPLVVNGLNYMYPYPNSTCPVNIMIHNLVDRMEQEAIRMYAGEK